jgi:DNA modification methylase
VQQIQTRSDRTFRDKPFSTVGNGLKPKDLCGIPWEVALALRKDGWWLRQDIIWAKSTPKPESIKDRCTTAHEYIFLLSKSQRYYFDADAIKEPAISSDERAKRSVWSVPAKRFDGAHFATCPPDLIEPCIKAGCPIGGTVLDPFGGAGTTGLVANRLRRNAILIELNPNYVEIAKRRIAGEAPLLAPVTEVTAHVSICP